MLRREFEVFGDRRYERLSRLSASHLYNLRRSKTYRARRTTVNRTRPTTVGIGERRRPDPGGKPGFVRADTVHQGDRDREKGVYDINLIDEVTQFEHVGAVAAISEAFLLPVLEEMLVTLPFVVLGFHADNGSEYINHRVAALLNKLHIPDFTKSRARRSNDNALRRGRSTAPSPTGGADPGAPGSPALGADGRTALAQPNQARAPSPGACSRRT